MMKMKRVFVYCSLFYILSFLGFILESLFFFIYYNQLVDRGFLTLPFCPIYGFTIIIIYLLFQTPMDSNIFKFIKVNNKILRYVIYFLVVTIIPTLVELVVGFLFDNYFNFKLWDYSELNFNYKGYISLEFSLIWGILLLIFMSQYIKKIINFLDCLSYKSLIIFSLSTTYFVLIDFLLNLYKCL